MKAKVKAKVKELLFAKSTHYRSKKDLEYKNANLEATILTVTKEMERLETDIHYSIASAVDSAKLKERKMIVTLKVIHRIVCFYLPGISYIFTNHTCFMKTQCYTFGK
jgi:hypothetical protein